MARKANPYMADAGQYNAINEGVNNLANAFLSSQPDPVDAARAQALAWQGRESRQKVQDLSDASRGRQDLGNLLRTFDPTGDNRDMIATGVGTGGMEVDDLGSLMRVMQSNFGGTDEQVGRAVVGAGDTLGEDDFVSLDDREMGRSRNSDNRIREDQAVQTLDQSLGGAFRSGQLNLEDIYSAQHPNRYADAAETRAGGGEGGEGGVDWLAATRRGTVEGDADEAINLLAEDAGMSPSDVPPELRQSLLDGAVRLSGQNLSPRAAVNRLWDEYNVSPGKEGGVMGFFADDVVNFDIPQAPAQPRDNLAQPGTAGSIPSLQMPDGATATPQEIEETARNRGIAPAQVIKQLEAAGGRRIPGA